jgi:hypothetical protein
MGQTCLLNENGKSPAGVSPAFFRSLSRAALFHFLSQQKQYLKNISEIQYMRAATLRSLWHFSSRRRRGIWAMLLRDTRPPHPQQSVHTKLHTHTLAFCSRKMSIIRTARVSPVLLLIRRCHCSSAPIRSILWGRRIWIALGWNYSIKRNWMEIWFYHFLEWFFSGEFDILNWELQVQPSHADLPAGAFRLELKELAYSSSEFYIFTNKTKQLKKVVFEVIVSLFLSPF